MALKPHLLAALAAFLLPLLPAQDAAATPLEAAWKAVLEAGRVEGPRQGLQATPLGPGTPAARPLTPEQQAAMLAAREEARKKQKAAAEAFLVDRASELKQGEGLYYRAAAREILGRKAEALADYASFRKSSPGHPKAVEAGLKIAQDHMYGRNDFDGALALAEQLQKEDKDGRLARQIQQILAGTSGQSYEMWKRREGLKGKALPEIPVEHFLGAGDFRWQDLKGKIVVLDFWATWCGPCRVVIPGLVRLQQELGPKGVQVVGVTRLYTYGWECTGREGDVLQGKSAGRDLPPDREIELNRIFHEKAGLNYPIVITKPDLGKEVFGITGIPTLFVVDRQGKVRGYKVGSGSEEELHKLVKSLLAERLG